MRFPLFITVAIALLSQPALAGWKLIPAGTPQAVGALTIIPGHDWNRGARIGRQGFAWTQDGPPLNLFEVFAAVPSGSSLYKERNKKRNPLPKFDRSLLLPELTDFFERSFRINAHPAEFAILETMATTLGGQPAVQIRYRYVMPNDELERLGEARLSVVNGGLYVLNFQAPALHYFDAGIVDVRGMMDGARLAR
jgi:hypothetical protein